VFQKISKITKFVKISGDVYLMEVCEGESQYEKYLNVPDNLLRIAKYFCSTSIFDRNVEIPVRFFGFSVIIDWDQNFPSKEELMLNDILDS
jgi:hypothetical protein